MYMHILGLRYCVVPVLTSINLSCSGIQCWIEIKEEMGYPLGRLLNVPYSTVHILLFLPTQLKKCTGTMELITAIHYTVPKCYQEPHSAVAYSFLISLFIIIQAEYLHSTVL